MKLTNLNRLACCKNGYQGKYKKVLCVCSAGLLRSPTAAFVLSQPPFNFNTRAAGIHEEYALIPVDDVLLAWADEIVCMEAWQTSEVYDRLHKLGLDKPVLNLNIDDCYEYRSPELIEAIKHGYTGGIKHDESRTVPGNDEGRPAAQESGTSDEGSGTV